jgi:hypothetical protein
MVIALLLVSKLETAISDEGISYRFFPFHKRKKTITWSDIEKAYVRKYKPIAEYGGWGLRLGFFGSGKAVNVSGNMGLQLIFRNGKKLLIGTKRSNEVQLILQQLKETGRFVSML